MNNQDKVVTLPEADEIMSRLKEIEMGANDYMAEKFFPLISQEAGRELVASGMVVMFTQKIYDFVETGYPLMMRDILHMYVPKFIDALVDDQDIAREAKRFHQQAMNSLM